MAVRGPSYPSISLADAIDRIGQVYRGEHTHRTTDAVVAKALGYKGLNGASRGVISALRKYGLLEPDGDGSRVSEDAVSIVMLESEDPRRIEAVRKAAFRPALFADLHKRYGGDRENLPSNSNMEHHLVTARKFNPKAASKVVQIYRDTLELVTEEAEEYTEAGPVDEQPAEASMQPQTAADVPPVSRNSSGDPPAPSVSPPIHEAAGQGSSFTESLEIRISGDSKVRLLFDGVVTKEAINKLVKYLELAADDYPSKSEVERAAVEKSSE